MTVFKWVLFAMMATPMAILVSLNSHYLSVCPKVPDLQTGQIYPLDNHGTIVYLTEAENTKMLIAKDSLIGVALLAIGITTANAVLKRMNASESK
jgi:hypothetical protein